MDTVSYLLFACDIISGIAFVAYVIYAFLKKYTPAIQRKISRVGSKILTNLKSKVSAKHLRAPSLQSPSSLHLNGPIDSPMSTDRIMSLEGITSTERFMSTERFATAERFMTAERFVTAERFMSAEGFMSTERLPVTDRFMSTDRTFSPVIKIRESEEENSESRRENSAEVGDELIVFSPVANQPRRMCIFEAQPRGSVLPVSIEGLDLPPEEPDFQDFAETLGLERRNRPRRSGRNKNGQVFKSTKEEDWTIELSRKNPKTPTEINLK